MNFKRSSFAAHIKKYDRKIALKSLGLAILKNSKSTSKGIG